MVARLRGVTFFSDVATGKLPKRLSMISPTYSCRQPYLNTVGHTEEKDMKGEDLLERRKVSVGYGGK